MQPLDTEVEVILPLCTQRPQPPVFWRQGPARLMVPGRATVRQLPGQRPAPAQRRYLAAAPEPAATSEQTLITQYPV
jgi:hypothetical protein